MIEPVENEAMARLIAHYSVRNCDTIVIEKYKIFNNGIISFLVKVKQRERNGTVLFREKYSTRNPMFFFKELLSVRSYAILTVTKYYLLIFALAAFNYIFIIGVKYRRR